VNQENNALPGEHLTLRYGKGEIPVDLKGFLRVKALSPRKSEPIADFDSRIRQALGNPVGAPPLKGAAEGAKSVVLSIPDRTRPRVAKEILPVVIDELLAAGVTYDGMSFFVATGTHGKHTEEDLTSLVGDELAGKIAIHQNIARERDAFECMGVTSRGTSVNINKHVVEADLNVVIGTVASHYFAGWGGGRKMILPGSSSLETAWSNHRLTLTGDGELNPMCRSGLLQGNPVHEDMAEAVGFLKNVFLINIILDGWATVADINAGAIIDSHLEATARARKLLEVPVGEKCDLAILSSGGYPLDIDFIQSHKSIDHAIESVRDGGVMIVLAECSSGAGSETFLPWFDLKDHRAVSARLLDQYELNGHTALSLMKKLERVRIVFVSSLEKEIVERMGMIPAENPEQALKVAGSFIGDNVLTYVFPCAWGILPVM
jgi:nickel-dependent lactate racemase